MGIHDPYGLGVRRLRARGNLARYAVSRSHSSSLKFLIDRCAGHLLAEWLRGQGHDVVESRALGPDPGDRALLEIAASEQRILVTIDTDFGKLVFVWEVPHAGLVRLPDVPTEQRIALMAELLKRHRRALERQAIITIRGGRIRISQPPATG